MIDDPDESLRKKFAAACMRFPDNAYQAACVISPTNFGIAAWIMHNWMGDPVVEREMLRLKAEDDSDGLNFLPGKAQAAKAIWDKAQSCNDPETFGKLMKLYAEYRGFIEKPGASSVVVNVPQPRVMIVKDHGTDEEWAAKVAEQQARLTSENAQRH
jgi:hypothetical protein